MTKQEEEQSVLDRLRAMEADAKKIGNSKKCIEGEYMLYHPWDRALIPGHIYSESGVQEARVSGSCEYHFDNWFGSKEETPELWNEATKSVVGPIYSAS